MATSKLNARRPSTAPDARDVKGRTGSQPAPAPLRGTVDAQQASRDFAAQRPPAPVSIDLRPSPDAGTALTAREVAAGLLIRDQASHTHALETVAAWKALKRTIEAHYTNIKRPIDAVKKTVLDMERKDLSALEDAIAMASAVIVKYVEGENRRRREEEDRQRRANEEQARQDREADQARREQEALDLEAQSPKLSAREQSFLTAYLLSNSAVKACRHANYADCSPAAAEQILNKPKIQDAIASARAAAEIRDQAAAVKAQPLAVEAPRVESNLGRAAGTRMVTTYSCEPEVDVEKLFQAAILNPDLRRAFAPNTVYLNQQARALRESFESVFPGCRLHKSTTVAG